MQKRNIVRMQDIADRTGVSPTTVSRVMTNQGNLSQATRDRVFAAARELGYYDNRLSNAIRTGKTGTIGVMLNIRSSYFIRMLAGFCEELKENDYLPVIAYCANDDRNIIHRLIEQRVDGIIIAPSQDNADNRFYSEVTQCGIPMIAVDREVPADIDFIGTDDYCGGSQCAELFFRRGCRKLLYYPGPAQCSSGRLRVRGFLDFCKAHPELSVVLSEHADWTPAPDPEVRDFLLSHPDSDAIGCYSDSYARQVVSILEELRPAVRPMVCGFGNLTADFPGIAPIPTFEQFPERQGILAVRRLLQRIEHPDLPVEKIRLKPEFREASSIYPSNTLLSKNRKENPK